MEREKVKRILKFFRDIDNEIALNEKFIEEINDQFYSASGGSVMESFAKSRNKITRPTETTALNIPVSAKEDIQYYKKENERLSMLKRAIMNELNKLPFQQKTVIYGFYIQGDKWERISEQSNYSVTQCKNIRNRGLEKLALYFSQNKAISGYRFPA